MRTRGKALGQNHIANRLRAPDTEIGNPPVGTGNPLVETEGLPTGTEAPPIETETPPLGTDSRVMRAEIKQMAGTPDMKVTVTGIWM